jgi:hypothetical protein
LKGFPVSYLPTRRCSSEGRTLNGNKEREEREQAENEEKIKEKDNEEENIYKKKMEEVTKWHIVAYLR